MRSLVESFIPVAESNRRARGVAFLRPIIEAGRHVAAGCQTARGVYAFTPDGRFLASTHEAAPMLVARTLERGLERFRAVQADRDAPFRLASLPRFPAYPSLPEGGAVLKVTVRDVGRPPRYRRTRRSEWNQDNAWLNREDLRSLLPESIRDGVRPDESFAVASPLVHRLARLHLLDHARACTSPFGAKQVRRASLVGTVIRVSGDDVTLQYQGETDCEGPFMGKRRGVTLRLFGRARYDRAARRFRALRLVALGTRRGHTRFNGRTAEGPTSRIGILLERVEPSESGPADDRLPPSTIGAYGWR